MIADYGFDAMRVDTVRHVPLDFWAEFTRAANVFSIAEVWFRE
jgi:alpha-amylase